MMLSGLVALSLVAASSATVLFKETFDDDSWKSRWTMSKARSDMGVWDHSAGEWFGDEKVNLGMRTSEAMKFYGTSAKLEAPFSNRDKDLVVQFSVKHEKREYSFCGGGYIKLLPTGTDGEKFDGDSPYHIMFGPDMCGYDVSRIHLIFNFNGENLLKSEDIKLDYGDKNEFTHLYTLVLKPDNTYTVYFDMKEKATGSLYEGWDFPKKEIDDPTDKKPEDWVDEKKIPDESDVKPEGWDDIPEQIPDPDASKPEDWDDEDDGEWEAPMIDNPEYKGEWVQKMIDNPAYKGEWSPKQIPNDKFTEDIANYDDIGAVGFELWVVNEGSVYDNIFVGDSYEEAKAFAAETFEKTVEAEKDAKKAFDDAKKAKEEAEKAEAEAEAGDDEEEAEDDEAPAHEEL